MSRLGPGTFRLSLSLLVVVHHSFPLRLGPWAVYVFFILSGYWICRMWRRRYRHTENAHLTFIVSRWWRLAPTFLVCTALGVVSTNLLQAGGTVSLVPPGLAADAAVTWWVRQFLIVGAGSAGTELPPAWSLDVEMQFYLLAPFVLDAAMRLPPRGRVVLVSAGLVGLACFLIAGGPTQCPQLPPFVGFFFLGATLELSAVPARRHWALWSLAGFFCLTAALLCCPLTRSGIWLIGRQTHAALSPNFPLWWVWGAALGVPFVAWNVRQPSGRVDRWLGNLAYPLYLFHWIPRQWYYHLSANADGAYRSTLLATNVVVAFLGAVLILIFVDQPLDKRRAAWVARRLKDAGDGSFAAAPISE